MIRFECPKRTVYISSRVVDIFGSYIQRRGENESGGILLGNVYSDHDEITDVTVPNELDQKGPMFFHRSKAVAQARIDGAWIESCGSLVYLGEWHTHSQIKPRPSSRDLKMVATVFAETVMDLKYLYTIVVGRAGNYWIGVQTSDGLQELEIII